jgi:hypothetical protein
LTFFYLILTVLTRSIRQSLLNPSDAEVKTKTISQVSLSDMQDKALFCVKNCVTEATLKKTFDDAKEKLKKRMIPIPIPIPKQSKL